MNLKNLLKIVVEHNASDLHLCVGLPPVMRIHGKLERLGEVTLSKEDVVEMLKDVISEKKIDFTSSNEVDLGIEIKDLARFRVNVYRDDKGLCATFRYIPNKIKNLQDLGLPPSIEKACYLRRGLVLVTGIVGSGKSTTLASIIDAINTQRSEHIITIEDPIEFVYTHKTGIVNQREVGAHTSSFANALRAALREDPDVILVGELRDLDTISMAITAAETGHLVFATLHTRGATQTVDRIIDVFPSHQQEQIRTQVAEVLEMVISQVLIPSIDGTKRYLAAELMVVTPAIRHLIRNKKIHQLKTEIEIGSQHGMQTLEKSLKELVEAGKVSLDAVLPWVSDKNSFGLQDESSGESPP